MKSIRSAAFALVLGVLSTACHPGAVVNADPQRVGGTIAGMVRATEGSVPLLTRKVTIVNVATGQQYEGTTGPNGGYTIQVPQGTYRLEVEVRDGETVSRKPDDTQVNNSDLDTGRDFEITVR